MGTASFAYLPNLRYLRDTLTIRYLQHADCADNADAFLFFHTSFCYLLQTSGNFSVQGEASQTCCFSPKHNGKCRFLAVLTRDKRDGCGHRHQLRMLNTDKDLQQAESRDGKQ